MEEKIKKENKFIDNVAYKSKFQFLIWVNDNVICQRYFKINGFNEESIYTKEFTDCMNGIVQSIQKDLESKSRIYMWYTNMLDSMKSQGFITNEDIDKYGDNFFHFINNNSINGDVVAPDGKIFHKEYIEYGEKDKEYNTDIEKPLEGEYVFKFSFLIDDKPVFEKIWEGNIYPKFVRNGVDLTNNYSSYDSKESSSLSFGAAIIRHMQSGKINLISDFIRRICDTLSNSYTEKNDYTKEMGEYRSNNKIDSAKYEEITKKYGVVKLDVTGHVDIVPETKKYNYLSAFEAYRQSWKKACAKKTREYYEASYNNLSPRYLEYIDRKY